jgi:hypothetical protein
MKRLFLTLALLPLLSSAVGERVHQSRPVADSPIPVNEGATLASSSAGAILIPLGESAAFTLTSPESGVDFDIDGDGDLDRVAWPAAGAEVAFLARDLDDDGRITSGKEIFGSYTMPSATNGCSALIHALEASGAPRSGSIHDGHALYDDLLLWVDRNHNGISEAGELRSAREAFTAIGMGFQKVDWRDEHGNRVRFEGWTQLRTGGPEQAVATFPPEPSRQRRYFEVALAIK